jgi:hypothetical protein
MRKGYYYGLMRLDDAQTPIRDGITVLHLHAKILIGYQVHQQHWKAIEADRQPTFTS